MSALIVCSVVFYILYVDGPPTHPGQYLWHRLPYATSRPRLAYRRAPQTRIPTLLIVFCVHVLLLVGRCEFRPNKRRPVVTAGVLLFKGPQARRCTHKAVHTQGGTHKRRSVATAGVLLLKGPQARRCTHKAEHTKGGLWPPQESCYLRGHKHGGTHKRRCTHKAEHTKGGL